MNLLTSTQQADPLGALSGRAFPVIAGVAALAYAIVATLRNRPELTHPAAGVLALLLLAAAVAVLIVASSPSRAPFGTGAFAAVLVLALASHLVAVAASWGGNRLIQDDGGQIALALLLLGMSQLRPARDLAVAAVVGGVVVGWAAAIQAPFLVIANVPTVYAVVAGTPVVALGLAAARYAATLADSSDEWTVRSRSGRTALAPEFRENGFAASRYETADLLDAEAFPLLGEILQRGVVTADDIAAATRVAAGLRDHAVAVLETTWLHDLLRRRGAFGPVGPAVSGERHAIEAMTADQRAVVEAAVAAVCDLGAEPATLTASVTETRPGRSRFELRTDTSPECRPARIRRALTPHLAVLRVIAGRARLATQGEGVTLGFDYAAD